jgi:hypothetical protein
MHPQYLHELFPTRSSFERFFPLNNRNLRRKLYLSRDLCDFLSRCRETTAGPRVDGFCTLTIEQYQRLNIYQRAERILYKHISMFGFVAHTSLRHELGYLEGQPSAKLTRQCQTIVLHDFNLWEDGEDVLYQAFQPFPYSYSMCSFRT